ELEHLLRGLDGRFVPPGLLGEPMWNPAVLPTGRDGYPIDPSMLPTPEAWEVAKRLVDEFLARYYREHRSWPEAVGVVIWGVHELCTGGLNIAMVLYLLGVRPVWDPDSGRVIGVELIPLRDLRVRVDGRWLRRPRIDVVVWAALHMEAPLKLLADAFYLVSHVDEPSELNYRRRHYLELRPRVEEELRRRGYSAREARELADVIASSGYFAQPPGVFTGAGASDVVEHAWTDVSGTVGVLEGPAEALRRFQERFWGRFREACEARMAYVYSARARIVVVRQGERVRVMVLRTSTDEVYHAIPSVTAFRYLMSKVRVVVHSVVNTWGLIDTDDFYDWVGGMALYATFASGRAPEVYIANAIDPTAARTRSAFEQLAGEVYTKLLSPSWWSAMLRHGDYGWSRVARRIEFLAGWGITVPSLRAPLNGLYTRVASRLLEELSRHPPSTEYGWASVVSSLAWFVELARLGVWRPQDRSVLVRVAQTLLRVMARHGPATCHHTSPNPALVAYAVRVLLEAGYSYSEIAGLVNRVLEWYQRLDNPEIVRQIRSLLREVLQRYGRAGAIRAAPGSAASPGVRGARSASVQGAQSGPSAAVGRSGMARSRGGSTGSAARPAPSSALRSALGAVARAVATAVRAVAARSGSVSALGGALGPSGRAGSGLGGRGGRTVTIGVRGAPVSGRLSAGRVGGGASGSSGSVSRASAVRSVSSAARGAVGRSAARASRSVSRAASALSRAAAQAASSVRRIWEWVLALVLTVLIVSGWVAARRGVGVAWGPRW
ncbi:MAG: cobaltochelatase subunit CobN, partial [Euryarchaeota archaeon]